MSCFLVPVAQAVATSIYRHCNRKSIGSERASVLLNGIPNLEKMLWGGSVMLIVDHIINGELSWAFPFFTALSEVGGAEVFWREILLVGVPMSLALTAFWLVWTLAFARIRSKA